MTDTGTRPHLTVDEIALLREVVRWRRSHDVEYLPDLGEYRDGRRGCAATWVYPPGAEIGMTRDHHRSPFRWIGVRTVTEAVDVLVVFGYLPARFSSAYRTGWHASRVWHANQFRRMFHDPEAFPFPAGDKS